MNANQTIALMRTNARRCAESKKERCSCRCGGQFHGQAHPASWVTAQAEAIRAEWTRESDEWQPRLPGVARSDRV